MRQFLFIALIFLLSACEIKFQEFNYGVDLCEECVMTISEIPYATEIISKKGKIYKFDSIECAVAYLNSKNSDLDAYHSIWLSNVLNPQEILPFQEMKVLHSPDIKSPMAGNYAAIKLSDIENSELQKLSQLKIFDFKELIKK